MAYKIEIQGANDDSAYLILTTNDKGAVKQETVTADPAMDHKVLGRMLSQQVKTHGAQRIAALSLLGLVYSMPNLDGFAGKADKDTGKVSNEFKSAVRDAETAAINALVKEGAIKLPGKGGEPELQEFLSVLRDDKNYSNAKVTTNKYFAFVGDSCVTKNGFIIPVPVMQARIKDTLPQMERDDTVAAALRAVLEKMGKITIGVEDAMDSLSIASTLVATLTGIVNYNSEMATKQHSEGASVVTASTKAIQQAMTTPIGAKHAAKHAEKAAKAESAHH